MSGLNSNIIQLTIRSDIEIAKELALRVKQRRLELNLTQLGLAKRSGVNIETYRKFERTGEISLRKLIKIAIAISAEADFEMLFHQRKYESMSDVLNANSVTRKRGKKK